MNTIRYGPLAALVALSGVALGLEPITVHLSAIREMRLGVAHHLVDVPEHVRDRDRMKRIGRTTAFRVERQRLGNTDDANDADRAV